jgi:MFS family permease
MDTKSIAGLMCAYVLMMTAFCANYGPIATFLAELFGSRVRYSGLSVAYMLAGLLGSAITPVVTTALLKATGQGSSVAWFLIGSAVVSLVGLLLLSETLRSNLDSVHEAPVRAASTLDPEEVPVGS